MVCLESFKFPPSQYDFLDGEAYRYCRAIAGVRISICS